jgi:hypothetical protein
MFAKKPRALFVSSTAMLARLEVRHVMQGKVKEHWMQLCEQAAIEQDSEKLMALVTEINRMLDEKDRRLKRQPVNDESD